MNKLSFVIGATASGKTYFIKYHFKDVDAEILNIYDYQQKAYDEAGYQDFIPLDTQFRCLKRANDMHLNDIIEKLKQGRDVIAEQTFYKAKRRIAYIDAIRRETDAEIEVYMMSPSEGRWKENIQKRDLKRTFESFKLDAAELEFPNPAEGFDRIFEVADGVVTQRTDPVDLNILAKAREELAEEAERIRKEDEAIQRRRELLESMNARPFWHYCEVCGKKEYITAEQAFDDGWDYPPQMGSFGMLSPRTCGDCGIDSTLWWKIQVVEKLPVVIESELTMDELATLRRIKGEPESLLTEESR